MEGVSPSRAQPSRFDELAAQLWAHAGKGAWEDVAGVSAMLKGEFPSQSLGYVKGAFALRQLRRYDEADTFIVDAVTLFPEDPQPLVEAARIAQARGDWRTAIVRSALLAKRFPLQAAGYLVRAHAHRSLGEFADAERVLAEGTLRFPGDSGFQLEACWCAIGQDRWELALERCARLREAHPGLEAAYRIHLLVLKRLRRLPEARTLLADLEARLGASAWTRAELLRLIQDQEGPEKAAERALEMVGSHPAEALAYEVGSRALRQMGRLDDAERLLQCGVDRVGCNAQILSERALLAQDRGDWATMDERWSEARRQFPGDRDIALWHARSLVLPRRPVLNVEEAHRRYLEVHATFPDLGAAYADHIQMFRNADRLEEAEDVARSACLRMPQDAQIRIEFSRIAADRGDPAEALARLVEVQDRFPDHVAFQCRRVVALAAAGRTDEAETLCAGLIARHADSVAPYIEYAEMAMRRQEWPTAIDRWNEAHRRFPENGLVQMRLYEANYAGIEAERQAPAAADPSGETDVGGEPRAVDELPMEDVVLLFESLAGTFQGCEFGAVQRHFGREPLGLFRWGQIDIDDIILAMESRLEGMGTPEQTELLVEKPDGAGVQDSMAEYRISDVRYGMKSHTFIRATEMPFDKMYSQSLRRLQFLQRKLLEDLAESRKIFVYKRGHAPISPEQARRLAAAVSAFCPTNHLLCVHLATREGQAGTAERVSPNLLFGYVSHFTLTPGRMDTTRVPAYSEWAGVCRKAYELWREAGAASGA